MAHFLKKTTIDALKESATILIKKLFYIVLIYQKVLLVKMLLVSLAVVFLKMGHSRPIFLNIRLFNTVDSTKVIKS